MDFEDLSEADHEMLGDAIAAAERLYVEGCHEVAAAVRAGDGRVFTAIHLEAPAGKSVCGEVAAICCMVAAGTRELDTVCAVWRDTSGRHFLLPPCGSCREVIRALNPDARVIVSKANDHWHPMAIATVGKVPIGALLPLPYRG